MTRFVAIRINHCLDVYKRQDIEHVVKELHHDIAVVWIDSLTPQFVKKCREHNLQVLALVLGLDDKTEENQSPPAH